MWHDASCMGHDLFIYDMTATLTSSRMNSSICDMTDSDIRCVTWLVHVWYVTWLYHMWNVTCLIYMWCVTLLIRLWYVAWLTFMWYDASRLTMGWLRWVGSLKWYVSFAKQPYKRDYILQKRLTIWRSLLIVATPYVTLTRACIDSSILDHMIWRIHMWHVTCLIHMWHCRIICDTWRDSLLCDMMQLDRLRHANKYLHWFLHTWHDCTTCEMWHDSFICDMWNDWFIRDTWHASLLCDMMQSDRLRHADWRLHWRAFQTLRRYTCVHTYTCI